MKDILLKLIGFMLVAILLMYAAATMPSCSGASAASGIQDWQIAWGLNPYEVDASDMPITDSGGYYVGTEVETALQEAGAAAGGLWTDAGTEIYPTNGESVMVGGSALGSADIILDVSGAAVFNEQSADVDFRIESDGNENLFYVDAGLDAIGIGTIPSAGNVDILDPDATLFVALRAKDGSDVRLTFGNVSDTNNFFLQEQSAETVLNFGADTGNDWVFNEGSTADIDIRMEGAGDSALFLLDGSADFIGISDPSPDSTLDVEGSFATTFTQESGSTTLDSTDHTAVFGGLLGNATCTLPSASGITGREYWIKADTAIAPWIIIIGYTGGDADDVGGVTLIAGQTVHLVSDGTATWYVLHWTGVV